MEMRKVLSENESRKFLNRIILVAGAASGLLRSLGTSTDVANLTTVNKKQICRVQLCDPGSLSAGRMQIPLYSYELASFLMSRSPVHYLLVLR